MKTWLVRRDRAAAKARLKSGGANCRELTRACNTLISLGFPCELERPLHDMKTTAQRRAARKRRKTMTNENGTKQKPTVKLVGEDGNAFAILGRVKRALVKAGMQEEAKAFMEEATAGDYNHLLATVQKYVDVE